MSHTDTLTDRIAGEAQAVGNPLLIALTPILLEIILDLIGNCGLFSSDPERLAQQMESPTLIHRWLIRREVKKRSDVPRNLEREAARTIANVLAGSSGPEILGLITEMREQQTDWSI